MELAPLGLCKCISRAETRHGCPNRPCKGKACMPAHPCLVKIKTICARKGIRRTGPCRDAPPCLVHRCAIEGESRHTGRPEPAWPRSGPPPSCENLAAPVRRGITPLQCCTRWGWTGLVRLAGLQGRRKCPRDARLPLRKLGGGAGRGNMPAIAVWKGRAAARTGHRRGTGSGGGAQRAHCAQAAARCSTHCAMASLSPISFPLTKSCGTVCALASAPNARLRRLSGRLMSA